MSPIRRFSIRFTLHDLDNKNNQTIVIFKINTTSILRIQIP